MSESNEGKSSSVSRMGKLSLETNRFPRDLLQRFMATSDRSGQLNNEEEEDESEEIELSLGLSLGGRFGIDKSTDKKLMRSSSIAGSIPIVRDDDAVATPPVQYPVLIRTSSLPVETEHEWRKRKELQTLRRMEAKRRRSEKQRNLKGERDSGSGGGGGEQYVAGANRLGSSVGIPFGLPNWAATARQALLAGGKLNFMGGGGQTSGSIESQGGSSSGLSESESRPVQGSSSCGEASPGSIQSLQDRSNQEAAGSSGGKARENAFKSIAQMEGPSKRPEAEEKQGREMALKLNSMEDMPCVFTQGDGPNGRRIEGILYRYGKGEEVRIMCICHGSFLSPAEFVKHAGGGDVAHPLKHIVVNPSSSSFL